MFNSKQFLSSFLSNDLTDDFDNSASSTEMGEQTVSSSLLDGVVVFPDGSVMWIPDSAAGRVARYEKVRSPYKTKPSHQSNSVEQGYPGDRDQCPSAVALVKRVVKQQMLSFQRSLR